MGQEPKKRIRDSNRTQLLLIKAVRSQLVEAGFASLSTQLILKAAGVSKGALFHHYPTKNHLIADAFEDLLVGFAEKLHHIASEIRQGIIDKRTFLERVVGVIESDLFIGSMEIALGVRAEPVLADLTQDAITRWRQELFRFWVETFDLPGQTEDDVRMHWIAASNTLRGQAFTASFGAPDDVRRIHIDSFMRFYLDRAQVRPAGTQDSKIITMTKGRKS